MGLKELFAGLAAVFEVYEDVDLVCDPVEPGHIKVLGGRHLQSFHIIHIDIDVLAHFAGLIHQRSEQLVEVRNRHPAQQLVIVGEIFHPAYPGQFVYPSREHRTHRSAVFRQAEHCQETHHFIVPVPLRVFLRHMSAGPESGNEPHNIVAVGFLIFFEGFLVVFFKPVGIHIKVQLDGTGQQPEQSGFLQLLFQRPPGVGPYFLFPCGLGLDLMCKLFCYNAFEFFRREMPVSPLQMVGGAAVIYASALAE